jgi:hypothetical protein
VTTVRCPPPHAAWASQAPRWPRWQMGRVDHLPSSPVTLTLLFAALKQGHTGHRRNTGASVRRHPRRGLRVPQAAAVSGTAARAMAGVGRRSRSSGDGDLLSESVPPKWPFLANPSRTPPTAHSLRWGHGPRSCDTLAHWPLGRSEGPAARWPAVGPLGIRWWRQCRNRGGVTTRVTHGRVDRTYRFR